MSYSCTLTKTNYFRINAEKQLHSDIKSVRVCYSNIDDLALQQMGTFFLVYIRGVSRIEAREAVASV